MLKRWRTYTFAQPHLLNTILGSNEYFVIGLTRPGFELPTFRMGELLCMDSASSSDSQHLAVFLC